VAAAVSASSETRFLDFVERRDVERGELRQLLGQTLLAALASGSETHVEHS